MKHASSIAILAFLAACTGAPDAQESGIAAPSFWSRLTSDRNAAEAPIGSTAETAIDHQWWTKFDDATLNSVMQEALASNKSLQIAKARIEEARAARGLSRSILLPELNGTLGASRGNQGNASGDRIMDATSANLQASWEFDLFGRNQARLSAANAMLQSQEEATKAVTIGLQAEVARNYFDLRNAERQIELTRQNLDTQKKTAELTHAQQDGALASDFDVQRAEAQVSTTQALVPALEAARDAALNRLNVLLGQTPGTRDAALAQTQELKPLNQHILIAAPATVLANRPDVRAAERQLAASVANSRAAARELFPNISLTGLFGAETVGGNAATPWGIGFNLAQPILNFGRIESQIDIADAQEKQAYLTYQQTILEALENTENTLSAYLHETVRNAALTNAVMQNRKAAQLARGQYDNGYAGLLDVLVAERNLLDSESAKTTSDFLLRKNLVNIYAATGGGWEVPHTEPRR